jgi:hypothetical protein
MGVNDGVHGGTGAVMGYELHDGDCLDVMRAMDANSVDTVVCDPPYGLSFMGKNWDHGVPGVAFWQAALQVAKPGAMLLAFGGTRTHHRLMVAIEDAGWEIRDVIMWVYGSGFPKSHDILTPSWAAARPASPVCRRGATSSAWKSTQAISPLPSAALRTPRLSRH